MPMLFSPQSVAWQSVPKCSKVFQMTKIVIYISLGAAEGYDGHLLNILTAPTLLVN
jgi:hypothetical protein